MVYGLAAISGTNLVDQCGGSRRLVRGFFRGILQRLIKLFLGFDRINRNRLAASQPLAQITVCATFIAKRTIGFFCRAIAHRTGHSKTPEQLDREGRAFAFALQFK